MTDDVIKQELLKAGWNLADVDALLVSASTQVSPATVSDRAGRHHFGWVIFFFVVVGINFLVAYVGHRLSSKNFILGVFVVAVVLTGIFALVSFLVRKIGHRFGKKWAVMSWIFIALLLPAGILGAFFLQQDHPSPSIQAFQEQDLYESPPPEWKTYINEPFNLSLRYPSTMELNESPVAFGFEDVYGVSLEQKTSSTTGLGISIFATADREKCDVILANPFGLPKERYKYKKSINGKEFLVGSAPIWMEGMAMQVFGYFQSSPVCKVVQAVWTTPLNFSSINTKDIAQSDVTSIEQVSQAMNNARQVMSNAAIATLSGVDYLPLLEIAESIIGSMDTEIKDTGSEDIMHVGESESVLRDQLTRIAGSRGAAFRVYEYNKDNTRKRTPSYLGTCEDEVFKSLDSDMTCRASKDAFIMYYKFNDKSGYVCGDATSYGIVDVEPKGLFCGGNVSVAPVVVSIGTAVNGKYSHLGVSKAVAINDCGIRAYKDDNEQSKGLGASDCFSQAIRSCQPSVISGVVDGLTSTYQIVGKEVEKCMLTQRFFKQVSDTEVSTLSESCMIDPTKGWPSLSDCVDLE